MAADYPAAGPGTHQLIAAGWAALHTPLYLRIHFPSTKDFGEPADPARDNIHTHTPRTSTDP